MASGHEPQPQPQGGAPITRFIDGDAPSVPGPGPDGEDRQVFEFPEADAYPGDYEQLIVNKAPKRNESDIAPQIGGAITHAPENRDKHHLLQFDESRPNNKL